MPTPEFIKEEFSEVYQEWWWTYELKIIFNYQTISWVTITSYFQTKPGREKITKELILELLKKMNDQILKPLVYQGQRKESCLQRTLLKVYKWETAYGGENYRLFFWFKDGTTNHLWIRNCHRID